MYKTIRMNSFFVMEQIKTTVKRRRKRIGDKLSPTEIKSSNSKYYHSDVVDIDGMFRIIESILSQKQKQ